MFDRSFSSILPAALLGLLCLSACSPKDDATGTEGATESPTATGTDAATVAPTTTDGTETAGTCDDHEAVDACCCFFISAPGDGGPTPPTIDLSCGDQPLCPSFEILCGDPDDPDDFMSSSPCLATTDDAALDCALKALAAGKAGSLQFELRNVMGGGFWGETLHYYIRGDGTAFRRFSSFYDSSSSAQISHRPLQPATFFNDCLSADSIEARVECIEKATTDEVLEQCIDA